MVNIFTRIKRHVKSKHFLFLEVPYMCVGALWLIFAPYKYHYFVTYYILAYALIAMVVDLIDWDKVKNRDQNSDS